MRCLEQNKYTGSNTDIFEVACPNCGGKIQFGPDDDTQRCAGRGFRVSNVKLNLDSAEWCKLTGHCADSCAVR